jgi:DNA repair exonuclease SbcCD nuclease subunit
MFSILVVGDLHVRASKLPLFKTLFDRVYFITKRSGCDMVVLLGDTFHDHEQIHGKVLRAVTDFINKLRKITCVIIIIGNHDRPNDGDFLSDNHPFVQMKHEWDNVKIIDKVKSYGIKDDNNKEHRFVFVPYVPPGRFQEALDTLDISIEEVRPLMIFAHQEFKGAQMGAQKSVDGDVWPLDAPPVISGHIHAYQKLQDNLVYVGTPLQHNFGEKDDKRVFHLRFSKGKLETDKIDLCMPKKKIIHVKVCDLKSLELPKDVEIKLIIDGDMSELKAIGKDPILERIRAAGVKIALNAKQNFVEHKLQNKSFSEVLFKLVEDNDYASEIYKEFSCV